MLDNSKTVLKRERFLFCVKEKWKLLLIFLPFRLLHGYSPHKTHLPRPGTAEFEVIGKG